MFHSVSNLAFLTCSILFAKTDPLVRIDLVFWKELNKCLLHFLLNSVFFAMQVILSNLLFWRLKWFTLCILSKVCPLLTTSLPLNWYSKSSYRQSQFCYLKKSASNFRSNYLKPPIGIMWYLHFFESTSCHIGGQNCIFYSQCTFHMCL